MSEVLTWMESQKAKTGEEIPERFMTWVCRNRMRLLKTWPKGERAFCRIIDRLRARMPNRWLARLRYTRQKWFVVGPETVFYGDFYFKNLSLLVEIDGSSHQGPAAQEKDVWRSKLISLFRNTEVLRFTNAEVLDNDFRDIEVRFVEAAAKRHGLWRLSQDYDRIKRQHPVYAMPEVLTTYR